MHRDQSGGGAELHHEIAVADGVHRVLGQARAALLIDKSEHAGDHLAVHRESRAGDGPAAEGTDIGAVKTIDQPFAIALEHFDVGQQMMRKINRLGALQMGVAGDDDVRVLAPERHAAPSATPAVRGPDR